MRSDDRDPAGDEEERSGQRRRGVSPVAHAARNKIGTVAGIIGILLVVGFLFLTGGKHTKPTPGTKPPAIASASGLPPPAPAPDFGPDNSLSSFEVPNNPQHFETGGNRAQAADAVRQKEEARMHSPMLVYDDSGHEEATAPQKPAAPDALNALLAAQLQNAAAAPDDPKGDH